MQVAIRINHLPPGLNNDGQKITPIGITIHSTGVLNQTARANELYFHSGDRQASAHLFVEHKDAVELLPWRPGQAIAAWHAGKYSRQFLSIEMCERSDPAEHRAVWLHTAWLAGLMCFLYGWDPWEPVTVHGAYGQATLRRVHSHHDITKLLGGTDHIDPEHYLQRHGNTMDEFRYLVRSMKWMITRKEVDGVRTYIDIKDHWAREAIEKLANLQTPDGRYLLEGAGGPYFEPDRPLTRAEAAALIYRVLRLTGHVD